MTNCGQCSFFFGIHEEAGDYKPGKGDCVTQKKDEKGKYWLSKPVFGSSETCPLFQQSQKIH